MSSAADDQDDRVLMARLIRGDEEAFAQFFDAGFEPLFRFALPRVGGDEPAAEDAVRQTMSEALRTLEVWRGRSPLVPWLTGLCAARVSSRHDFPDEIAGSTNPIDAGHGTRVRAAIHAEWQADTTRRAQRRVFTSLAFAIVVAVIILLFNCPAVTTR